MWLTPSHPGGICVFCFALLSPALNIDLFLCVCVCVCVCARACVHVHMCENCICVRYYFCISLHSQTDRLFALSRLKQSGAYLNTTEGVLLQLVQDAKHPNFKEVLTAAALCFTTLVWISWVWRTQVLLNVYKNMKVAEDFFFQTIYREPGGIVLYYRKRKIIQRYS